MTPRPRRKVPRSADRALAVAGAIVATKAAFARAFETAQRRAGQPHRDFKVVGTDLDDATAILQGVREAQAGGWIDELVVACIEERLATTAIVGALRSTAPDTAAAPVGSRPRRAARGASLQSITDPERGFATAVDFPKVLQCLKQTCRVKVDGQAAGSGFLIGPNVVLTAAHVVKDLVQNDAQIPNTAGRLSVEFEGLALTDDVTIASVQCSVADRWLIAWSPCHPLEIEGKLPPAPDLDKLDDFAAIELAELVGANRGFWALAEHVPAAPKTKIYVFQHPRGSGLAYDRSRIVERYATNRFIHSVNTDFGSSGGPCVNEGFRLVGLHHAGDPAGEPRNRGVPLAAFADRLIPRLIPNPKQYLWKLDAGARVIGRDDLQAILWEASLSGLSTNTRIISVFGGTPRSRAIGHGLVGAVLPASSDLVLSIDLATLPTTADQVVAQIIKAAGPADPTADVPGLGGSGTTEAAWIRNRLIPHLLARLEEAAGRRRVWLVLTDFTAQPLPPGQVEEFLMALLEAAANAPQLRCVLIGFRKAVPISAMPFHRPHRLLDPDQADLADFLGRWAPTLSEQDCAETAAQLWPEVINEEAGGLDRDAAIDAVLDRFAPLPGAGGPP